MHGLQSGISNAGQPLHMYSKHHAADHLDSVRNMGVAGAHTRLQVAPLSQAVWEQLEFGLLRKPIKSSLGSRRRFFPCTMP
eukprot:361873-Chlamydomonas_euryale.AAC.1